MIGSRRFLVFAMASILLAGVGCDPEDPADDDTTGIPADDDACDDDGGDDDTAAPDDDTTAGDDDSAADGAAPILLEMEIQYAIEGFGECVAWVIWDVEDPDGDLDGCAIHLTVGELYVPGTWSNPDSPGPHYELELRIRVPVGAEGDDSLDYRTLYDVDLWMQDAAGHASNHLVLQDWESPDEELCSSLDHPSVVP